MPRKPKPTPRHATPEEVPAATVNGTLGPIAVVRVAGLMAENSEYGSWVWHLRRIHLDAGLTGRALWHTFYHEQAHAALDDAGIKFPTKELEEHVCDAIATARVRERFG